MEIRKILWPTDLSARAAKVIPYLVSLSEKYQAEVHLLYVVEDVQQFDHFYGDASPEHLKELQEKIRQKAEKQMDLICSENLQQCPLFKRHTAAGDPASEILRVAAREKADLIVMATHGRGEEKTKESVHYPFGSVSEKVLRNAPVPVLLIPPASAK